MDKSDFYDCYLIEKFCSELSNLLKYEETKNNFPILVKYCHNLYETIFAVFKAANKNSSRQICCQLLYDIENTLMKCRQTNNKEFISFILNELKHLVEYFEMNLNKISKTYDEKEMRKLGELTSSFMRIFQQILYETKDKTLMKQMLGLILSMLKLAKKLDEKNLLSNIKYLISKHSYFNFKDHQEVANELLNCILELIYDLKDKFETNKEKYAKYFEELKDIAENFERNVKVFAKIVDGLQPIFFDKYLCRPIEDIIDCKEFFNALFVLNELISLQHYPTEAKDIARLKQAFKLSLSPENFNLVNPDEFKYYEQPAQFYLNFYRTIANTIKLREDLKESLAEEIGELIKLCGDKDNFADELHPGGVTIYFFILNDFTFSILDAKTSNDPVAKDIIDIWFNLYEKSGIEIDLIKSLFSGVVTKSSINCPELLADCVDKIWHYYLNEDNNDVLTALSYVFKYDTNVFQEKYEKMFHERFVEQKSSFYKRNTLLFSSITAHYPEYYLKKQNGQLMRIYEIMDLIDKDDEYTFLNAFSQVVDAAKINTSLAKYKKDLLESRDKAIKMLERVLNENNNVKLVLLSNLVASIYSYLAMNQEEGVVRTLVNEIVDTVKKINSVEGLSIVFALKKMGEIENKRHF